MDVHETADLWWKNAGVTCIWLMPFYSTADRDDGYDVSDHYAIDSRLGTFGDFTEFMEVARDRGVRVIADLVVNHTSVEHHWFQAARHSAESPFRHFYVWQDTIPEDGPEGVVFPGDQTGVWTVDPQAGQYYLHRFYKHQPDLNVANDAGRDEIKKVIGFCLAQGLSPFRVDAVPFLPELGDEDGDELNMLFDFIGMQANYLAMARGDARPIASALRRRPAIPREAAFASFLRNHDELTLDKLSRAEREEVFEAFGPDPDMQLYDRGLRRRLPPMLNGDQQWLRMAYSLMFSMPGAPTRFYGEEIGMGENLQIDGRLSVRTPMQWTGAPAASFTSAPADAACRPFPEGDFAPEAVNVADQRADPDSLLNWFERLIRLRKSTPEIAWGEHRVLDAGDDALLVMHFTWGDRTTVTVHNLASKAVAGSFRLDVSNATLNSRLGSRETVPVRDGSASIKIPAHGHRWFSLDSVE